MYVPFRNHTKQITLPSAFKFMLPLELKCLSGTECDEEAYKPNKNRYLAQKFQMLDSKWKPLT
jgi:hypothetical protein